MTTPPPGPPQGPPFGQPRPPAGYPQQGGYPQGPPPQGPPPQGPPPQGPPPQGPYRPQAPYPQQNPYPQHNPYPQPGPYSGPPPRKSRKRLFWVLGSVVGVVVLLGVTVIGLAVAGVIGSSVSMADEGDCLVVHSFSEVDSDVERAGCEETDALFQVGKKLEAPNVCPSEDYSTLTLTDDDGGQRTLLCLVPNLREGSCYAVAEGSTPGDKSTGLKNSDCASPDAAIKVAKRVEESSGKSACSGISQVEVLTYAQPARTLCLVMP